MTLTITIPRGVYSKQPPLNRYQPDISPQSPMMLHILSADQDRSEPNLEVSRQMRERTQQGNVRIRKLNDLKRKRRIDTVGLSSSEDEEPVF